MPAGIQSSPLRSVSAIYFLPESEALLGNGHPAGTLQPAVPICLAPASRGAAFTGTKLSSDTDVVPQFFLGSDAQRRLPPKPPESAHWLFLAC